MINWKELNYAKGIERIYDVLWAIYFALTLFAVIAKVYNIGFMAFNEKTLGLLFMATVFPYIIKRGLRLLLPWIWKGFTS